MIDEPTNTIQQHLLEGMSYHVRPLCGSTTFGSDQSDINQTRLGGYRVERPENIFMR